MKVRILGTEYEIKQNIPRKDNKFLEGFDGYTDDSSKMIVVCDCEDLTFDNLQVCKNKILFHEIIHSFLHESGLPKETCEWHCEEMVEWCATMMPKIIGTYDSIINRSETCKGYEGERYSTNKLPGVPQHVNIPGRVPCPFYIDIERKEQGK